MSGLEILSIAPNATVQDQGRVGYLRYGLCGGGAIDGYALAEGQALLGNRPDDAALEFAGFGGRFRARSALWLACSGAEMTLAVNGAPRPWRQGFPLSAGDELTIGAAKNGVFGYLHVAGGFLGEVVLGSRATLLRAGLGTILREGMVLPVGARAAGVDSGADSQGDIVPLGLRAPDYFARRRFRVLWAPQSRLFSPEVQARILAQAFTVSSARDRMGMRLDVSPGAGLQAEDGLTVASDATNLGDVQITGDGAPVVLLADRGPSGGYPRLLTVISADLGALAQVPSGETIGFDLVSRAEAVDELAKFRRKISALPGMAQPVVKDLRALTDLLAHNLIDGAIRGDEGDDDDD